MKNLKFIVALTMVSGLFLTSCEKEYDSNPLPTPGNTQDNTLRDGEVGSSDGTDNNSGGITDSGRDEDYDKSGKFKKKPTQN